MEDFDISFDLETTAGASAKVTKSGSKRGCRRKCEKNDSEYCVIIPQATINKRAASEVRLFEMLGVRPFVDGEAHHIISMGDIDSMSYLSLMTKHQSLDYVLVSTWCMALDDALQMLGWVKSGKIKRIDFYVGEIFSGTYSRELEVITDAAGMCGGRVAVFRNHSKIIAGTGEKYSFAIESSANINTNPRTENTCINISKKLFTFYKNFFDGITGFNKWDKVWQKWEDQ